MNTLKIHYTIIISMLCLIHMNEVLAQENNTNNYSLVKDWYSESFHIKAGAGLLDMADYDQMAHAAPYLADLNNDGKRDLIVGTYDGRFRFFQNRGSNVNPEFEANPILLLAGDQDAMVPNWCCVAAGPQLVDVDNDGVLDLASGSYGGLVYWFKGLGGTKFTSRQTLVDQAGIPLIGRSELIDTPYSSGNLASNLAWTDWNDDDVPDLIIGSGIGEYSGELFLRLGAGMPTLGSVTAGSALPSQPAFLTKNYYPDTYEIKVSGEKAINETHAAPAIADWDGDGLQDILLGSISGRVYLLRNSGEVGAPVFNSREVLLEAGDVEQWMPEGTAPRHGARSQIHVADYNMDGKMDLLVGTWFNRSSPRKKLSRKERKQVEALRQQMDELDREIGLEPGIYRYKSSAFGRSDKSKTYNERRKELEPFLQSVTDTFYGRQQTSSSFMHSHIMVYIQK